MKYYKLYEKNGSFFSYLKCDIPYEFLTYAFSDFKIFEITKDEYHQGTNNNSVIVSFDMLFKKCQ